jgi:hypothetical protein
METNALIICKLLTELLGAGADPKIVTEILLIVNKMQNRLFKLEADEINRFLENLRQDVVDNN